MTKDGVKPHVESLYAVTRMMYARKHFSPGHRALYGGAVLLRHLLRVGYAGTGELGRQKRAASRAVVATMLGRRPVPFAADHEPGLSEHRRLGAAFRVAGSALRGRRRHRALTALRYARLGGASAAHIADA